MSRGIILYQSKYGATKKYADWLVEETGYDCIETKNAKVPNSQNYGVIILGGGVYASGIAGLQFIKKNIGHAYSARTAHPFQRNGAPFRFRLSKAQQVY